MYGRLLILAALLAAEPLRADTNRLLDAVQKAADYYRRGLHAEAQKAAAEALSLLENSRSSPDFDAAASLNNLGSLVYAQGDLDRAEQLFQRSREAYQALAGADDTRLASVLYNLAGVLVEQGKYAPAEALYRSSLQIREKSFGSAHPLVAEVWNDLGFLSLQQGKYKEAESWLAKALGVWEKSPGSEAYAAVALNNLGLLHRLQGGFDRAESFYKRAVAVEEKAFGVEHPEVATTLMSLAALYGARRRNAQATETYQHALTLLEKTVGAQDPLAVETREHLRRLSGDPTLAEYQILLVRTKEEAEALRNRIGAGEDFAALATQHSLDPSASNGGYFRVRPAELRKELRVEVDRLGVGQVSAAFPLAGNWAIVKRP
jgi:tetratricopeptide (TPR) repeat protein